MSISLTHQPIAGLCEGCSWTIRDEDLLAEQIAKVAVGQAEHVATILACSGLAPPKTTKEAIGDAVELLTAAADPYHRDGWMFQVMSWIAAHEHPQGGPIRTPHMITAHKGFDGLQVEINQADNTVTAVTIFEDKATENPRSTIRKDVWPEFRDLEAGKKQNVLAAEVTTLLRSVSHPDPSAAVEKILWAQARHYRASITVGAEHASARGMKRLFTGFDTIAPGLRTRRRGETLLVQDLRPWMERMALLAIAKARAMAI